MFWQLTLGGKNLVNIFIIMNQRSQKPFYLINYFLLLGIALIWGSQYFFIKIALESFSNSMITVARVGIGSIFLTFILAAKIENSEKHFFFTNYLHYLPDFLIIGFVEATLPCLLIAWAEKQVPSSVTAILMGTVPLFATVLESFFIKDRPFSLKKIGAMLLGFLGVLFLVGPEFLLNKSQDLLPAISLLPVLALLLAALCFAASVLLIKMRLTPRISPFFAAQGILTGATISAVPIFLFLTKPWNMSSFTYTHASLIALLLISVFAGGVVYVFYVTLIKRTTPSFASSANYLALPIGAIIGIVFANEKLTLHLFISSVMILAALWLLKESD
jgi:drug/metabolite transporter (DMT)-like permease